MIINGNTGKLEITILRRSYPESTDFEDANWLETDIKIDVMGFKGLYGVNLRTDDFERFYKDLEKLIDNQSSIVEFTTMEEGIYLKGILDMTGNIKWNGTAKSSCANSCFTFAIETDYTSIDDLLKQVQKILHEYPVVFQI
jgi:hypothetical protein